MEKISHRNNENKCNFCECGKSYCQISLELGISRVTCFQTIKIHRLSETDRFKIAVEINSEINPDLDKKVSVQKIRHHLNEFGLMGQMAQKKNIHLGKKSMSRNYICHWTQVVEVPYLSVRSIMSINETGSIYYIEGIMTHFKYFDIIKDLLLSYASNEIPKVWIYQADNDPKYMACIAFRLMSKMYFRRTIVVSSKTLIIFMVILRVLSIVCENVIKRYQDRKLILLVTDGYLQFASEEKLTKYNTLNMI
uniref:Uncharacterized protein n=1 Tax=Vespula pensylvanica TaxID=30213 RepID=A0A834KQH9_VESPE|nr:hypothetical protein H0235_013710 [Vespula pensylvanica]